MHAAMLAQHPRHIKRLRMFPTTPNEPEEEDESPEEEDEPLFGAGVGTKPGCTPEGNPAVFNAGVGEGTVAPTAAGGESTMAI